MERVSLLWKKLQNNLHRELILHVFGNVFFLCLAAMETIPIVSRLMSTEWELEVRDTQKIYVLAFGVAYINVFTSAILYLKYDGLKNVNKDKCQIWMYMEILNIFLLTIFLLEACRFLFPPPFTTTGGGVPLLFIVYWLPLTAYKTSQVRRMRQLLRDIVQSQIGVDECIV